MATIPSEDTVVVGGKITAAWGNADIRDAINFILDPPRLQASLSANVSLATSGTWQLISWDTETWDNDSMHSTSVNTSRLIAPTAGRYLVSVNAFFAPSSAGTRGINLTPNGAGAKAATNPVLSDGYFAPANNTNNLVSATVEWSAAANEYLELWCVQSSGGALNLIGTANGSKVSMRRLSA